MAQEWFISAVKGILRKHAQYLIHLNSTYPETYEEFLSRNERLEERLFPSETGVIVFQSKIPLRGNMGSLIWGQAWCVPIWPPPSGYGRKPVYFRTIITHERYEEFFGNLLSVERTRLSHILRFFIRKVEEDVFPSSDEVSRIVEEALVRVAEQHTPEECQAFLRALEAFYNTLGKTTIILPGGDVVCYIMDWMKNHGEEVRDRAFELSRVPIKWVLHIRGHCHRVIMMKREVFRRLKRRLKIR